MSVRTRTEGDKAYIEDPEDGWLEVKYGLPPEVIFLPPWFPPNIYDLGAIPYRIETEWVAQVLGAAFVLALLVAYFPARRAARMDPVKALSYE